jgi:altronate hydrolase
MDVVARYRAYAARGEHSLAENPSPGNKAGGLLNITIKALGALAKSGSAPVQGVLDYGAWLWAREARGLYLLDTPGYDQLSVPGLVAAGCQVVCFTTGLGTGIGNAIAPVIKIGSNDALYRRMGGDIDLNAGGIVSRGRSVAGVGRDIFNEIISVASGAWTKAELGGHREFAIWDREGITL